MTGSRDATAAGQGQFTATSSHLDAGLVVLPGAEGTVLGVGAEASWADAEPQSVTLTYELLVECDTKVPRRRLIRVLAVLTRRFSAWSSRLPPLNSGG